MSSTNNKKWLGREMQRKMLEDSKLRTMTLDMTPEETIFITHYVHPQLFSYLRVQKVVSSGASVSRIESQLLAHCQAGKQQELYEREQHVIVRFKPQSYHKYLRGLVVIGQRDEHIVLTLDYGFLVICRSEDLWPLPANLTGKIMDVHWGGVANIKPLGSSTWSKTAVGLLKKQLKNAIMLKFKAEDSTTKQQHSFGQLLIKTSKQTEELLDAASYLVKKRCAVLHLSRHEKSSEFPFNMAMAEINDEDVEPSLRVKTILKFMEMQQLEKDPMIISKYNSNSIQCTKNKGNKRYKNGFHALGATIRGLKCPSVQPERLEQLLKARNTPEIPDSALHLSRINATSDGSVESALIKRRSESSSSISSRSISSDSRCSNNTIRATEDQPKAVKFNSRNVLNFYRKSFIDPQANCSEQAAEESKLADKTPIKSAPDPSLDLDKLERIYNQFRLIPNTKDSLRKPESCVIHKSIKPSVLVHSIEHVPPIGELIFCQDVNSAMRHKNIETPMPTQQFAWPHLMRGNSVILFDRLASMRSWCYLPALCSRVMAAMRTGASNEGPLALLLTDSVENAQALSSCCHELMAAYATNMPKVINSHELPMEELPLALLNSCGILVTTLSHFKHLHQLSMNLINPRRLKYCVFDDYDRIRLPAPDLLKETLQLLHDMALPKLQLIVIAQQWQPELFVQLVKRYAHNPVLLFGDFLEAAIYGNVKLNIVLQCSSKKTQQLLGYLDGQRALGKRTVIFCKNNLELASLQESLTAANYEYIPYQEAANQKSHQLLLVLDVPQKSARLPSNFELMVHYSLPESWTKFSNRFHVFCDNIGNRLLPHQVHPSIASLIMLDESNMDVLPRLVQFFDAHSIKLDQTIRQMVASYRWQTDRRRQFCPQILSSGECAQLCCSKRHFVLSRDLQHANCDLWQPGNILRGQLVEWHSPVHLTCRATDFRLSKSESWQKITSLAAATNLGTALMLHMSQMENRRSPQKIEIYETCVLHKANQFHRVRVVDVIDEQLAVVQLIDEDMRLLKVKPSELLECDAKLKDQRSAIVDVRLCGLLPTADHAIRQPKLTKWFQSLVGNRNDNQYLQLVVEFAMFHVVYVKNITLMQECPTMKACVKLAQLNKELVSQGFARSEEQCLQKLRKIYLETAQLEKELVDERGRSEPVDTDQMENELVDERGRSEPVSKDEVKCLDEIDSEKKENTQESAEANLEMKINNENALVKMESSRSQSHEQNKPTDDLQSTTDQLKSDELFNNVLIQHLRSDIPKVQDAALSMLQTIFAENNKVSPPFNKSSKATTNTEVELTVNTAKPQISQDDVACALSCGTVAGNAVHPKVKWHQTLTQIELVFEQEVPEYQLLQHDGNVLIYQANETIPPQRCILNLLGEVRILSEQQHGYRLHVKLGKHGLCVYWPTLLNSLYAQQNSHWLVYDTERGEPPDLETVNRRWIDYERNQSIEKRENEESDSFSTDDSSGCSD